MPGRCGSARRACRGCDRGGLQWSWPEEQAGDHFLVAEALGRLQRHPKFLGGQARGRAGDAAVMPMAASSAAVRRAQGWAPSSPNATWACSSLCPAPMRRRARSSPRQGPVAATPGWLQAFAGINAITVIVGPLRALRGAAASAALAPDHLVDGATERPDLHRHQYPLNRSHGRPYRGGSARGYQGKPRAVDGPAGRRSVRYRASRTEYLYVALRHGQRSRLPQS